MKNKLFFISIAASLVFCINDTTAQGKCKFYIDEVDAISGKHHKAINVVFRAMAMYTPVTAWAFDFDRNGDDYSLISKMSLSSITNDKLQKGDSLMLKLESGRVLTVYAESEILPKPIISGGNAIGTSYFATYAIPYEDFKLLSLEKIIFIRINIGPLVFDNEMSEKAIPKLQNAAICILQ